MSAWKGGGGNVGRTLKIVLIGYAGIVMNHVPLTGPAPQVRSGPSPVPTATSAARLIGEAENLNTGIRK
jgi:hypothetical protein